MPSGQKFTVDAETVEEAKMASRETGKDFYRQQIYVRVVQTLFYDIVFLKRYLRWSKVDVSR